MLLIPKTPTKSKRNALVYTLYKKGLTLISIANDPEVIELSGGVMSKQRVSAIVQKAKREEQKTA